jgi:putative chitinase
VIDGDVMLKICPRMTRSDAEAWGAALQAAAVEFDITTDDQQAMWLAQLCHESAGFSALTENMNYSAGRLAQVWPHRYAVDPRAIHKRPNELAHRIERKPDCIANDVYANRMGNGAPHTGDGWRFRGRYPAHLTGRENYTRAGEGTGLDMLTDPDVHLRDLEAMARISAWFWWDKSLNERADEGDFGAVVKVWNGGHIGLTERIAWHKRAMDALGVA